LNTSLTDPLTPVKVIHIEGRVFKILRVGNQLLLGERFGWLEMFDINNSNITSSHQFEEVSLIFDILAIDDTHCFLAAWEGLLKTSKDQLIKHYFNGACVISLSHITEAIYLLGFYSKSLIVWDEKTD
jgi:hypothetical protein